MSGEGGLEERGQTSRHNLPTNVGALGHLPWEHEREDCCHSNDGPPGTDQRQQSRCPFKGAVSTWEPRGAWLLLSSGGGTFVSLKGVGIWVRTPGPEAGTFLRLAQVRRTCPWCHQEVLGVHSAWWLCPHWGLSVHSGKARSRQAQNVSFYIRPPSSETSNFDFSVP